MTCGRYRSSLLFTRFAKSQRKVSGYLFLDSTATVHNLKERIKDKWEKSHCLFAKHGVGLFFLLFREGDNVIGGEEAARAQRAPSAYL
jgi:hypothetical protein